MALLRRRGISTVLHSIYGSLLGVVPLLISAVMDPSHRSPYLLAYPAVIFAAWAWGLSASVACASVAGFCIEYYIFQTGRINLSPTPDGWLFRQGVFLCGSIMVGVLTRSFAQQKEKHATASLNHQLWLAQAQAAAAREKALATELARENEVRSQLTMDGAHVGLWEWDIKNNDSRWSAGYYRLHGLEPGDSADYQMWRQSVHAEDVERVEAAIRRAITDKSSFHEEYRVLLPHGEVRWIACQGAAILDGNGEVIRLSGYGGDVTRRKLADLALLQSEKMAIAGRLVATIAHEINNPLDAAMNILFLVRGDTERKEQAELLADALLQLERISQISRQTLNFSRSSLRASLCRPSTLIEETIRLLNPKLRMAQLEIATDLRHDPEFFCNRREVLQILTNLVNNAIEAMDGPGRLRIRTANSVDWATRTHPGVRITLADSGSGIPRELRQRIFEPFFTTKDGTGTGLGMWVVQELIRKQNGIVSMRSSIGTQRRGTSISLFIPFAIEHVKPVPAPAAALEDHAAL